MAYGCEQSVEPLECEEELEENHCDVVASPEVIVQSIASLLDFNPMTDKLTGKNGKKLKLNAPLPQKGFNPGMDTYVAPLLDESKINVDCKSHASPG